MLLDPAGTFDHALRVAVRGIHHQHVHAGIDQRGDALLGIATHANRGADQQRFMLVLGCMRVIAGLLDVLDGDQSAQLERIVDHQHFLDAVLVQQQQDVVLAGALAHRHQLFLAGHDVAHRIVVLAFEAQVATSDDANQLGAIDHRHAGDVVRVGQAQHFADRGVGSDGDRAADYAGLELFHQAHFGGLLLGRHVLVDDADAAVLRHRDGEPCFGDRIHGGGHDGDVQAQGARQSGRSVHIAWQHDRMGRNKEDVVVGQGLGEDAHAKSPAAKRELYAPCRDARQICS